MTTAIPFSFKEEISSPNQRPSFKYIEISFTKACLPRFLSFSNFYSAYISIRACMGSGEYETLVKRYDLMEAPDSEADAYDSFRLDLFNLATPTLCDKIRVYLFQPCELWLNFTIHDIAVLSDGSDQTPHSPSVQISTEQTGEESVPEGIGGDFFLCIEHVRGVIDRIKQFNG
ncbi:hypothetical protein PCE1_002561 [Barthelona sp. PCE]